MPKLKKLPQDCTFPQLSVVFDADRFAASLQSNAGFVAAGLQVRGIKLRRVYYKPGRSCRLTFEAKLRAPDGQRAEQFFYGKIYPDEKSASVYRRALRATLTPPELGPAVALLADLGMVVWAYPNDPNVPGLAILASTDAITALLERDPAAFGLPAPGHVQDVRFGVGKYVPGQRCGYRYRVRWEGPGGIVERWFYGKAYQPGLGRAAYDVLAQLAASDAVRSGRLRIPMPYGLDAEHDIVWQEMLPGNSFSKDAGSMDLAALAGPVASALAAFHASNLTLGPGLGLERELEELTASSLKIERAYPQFAARVAALRQRLAAAAPGLPPVPPAPVHGSFKTSHIFDAEGQVAFIDFDGAGLGDPTYDVGRFFAHLAVAGLGSKTETEAIDAAVTAFGAAYGAGVPWGWPDRRVRWYTSALLLSSQAYKCVKRMAPERVDAILTAAEAWFPAA